MSGGALAGMQAGSTQQAANFQTSKLLNSNHMGPEDNFCSTKISKDSLLAKWLEFGCHS